MKFKLKCMIQIMKILPTQITKNQRYYVYTLIVTAEVHRCFQIIWNPSGVKVAISSFGTRTISEEINCRFGPVVAGGLAVATSQVC